MRKRSVRKRPLASRDAASEAIKEAQELARESVTSAAMEIEKQTRVTRSERVTTEESEKNVHEWENKEGKHPKVTVKVKVVVPESPSTPETSAMVIDTSAPLGRLG